jgi:hypothetical protein
MNETEQIGPKYPEVEIQLTGEDGNVFNIIGRCTGAARRAGIPKEEISVFRNEMMSGDYDHALQTVMRWFTTR